MKQYDTISIKYRKNNGEETDRDIIPLYVPTQNIKALDVSGFTKETQVKIGAIAEEYNEYRDRLLDRGYSIEDWLAQVHPTIDYGTIKFRTFKPEGISLR